MLLILSHLLHAGVIQAVNTDASSDLSTAGQLLQLTAIVGYDPLPKTTDIFDLLIKEAEDKTTLPGVLSPVSNCS